LANSTNRETESDTRGKEEYDDETIAVVAVP